MLETYYQVINKIWGFFSLSKLALMAKQCVHEGWLFSWGRCIQKHRLLQMCKVVCKYGQYQKHMLKHKSFQRLGIAPIQIFWHNCLSTKIVRMISFQANQIIFLMSGVFFLAHWRTDESNRGKVKEKKGNSNFWGQWTKLFCPNFSRDTLQSWLIIVAW